MKRIPQAQPQRGKRIHRVVIKRMVDDSPDTSWLGEYSDNAESEFSIDRAHDLDCISQPYNRPAGEGLRVLESAQQYLMDQFNEVSSTPVTPDELAEWYDDGDTFISDFLNGDEEFCNGPCVASWSGREYRYFNPGSVEKFDANAWDKESYWREAMRKNAEQDYSRMEAGARGEYCFIGIRAEAELNIPDGHLAFIAQEISSGGLWGIESDSDESYLREVEAEELAQLRGQLHELGFSQRAVSAAFKNIEREEC